MYLCKSELISKALEIKLIKATVTPNIFILTGGLIIILIAHIFIFLSVSIVMYNKVYQRSGNSQEAVVNDTAMYHCMITNKLGKEESAAKLDVRSKQLKFLLQFVRCLCDTAVQSEITGGWHKPPHQVRCD